MSQPGRSETPGGTEAGSEEVLRAKYLDYCSARMAEVLLGLSPDEIYVLAEDAAREAGLDETEPLSYDRIVRLATQRLSRKIALPSFATWVTAYREDPTRFEGELLGLWRSDRTAGVAAEDSADPADPTPPAPE